MALNYADQVLKGGPSQIPSDFYIRHRKEFDDVFDRYKKVIADYRLEYEIKGQLPAIALHYWDATDYNRTYEIPEELREKDAQNLEAIDALVYSVNQHYPWDFNFQTRWFGGKEIPYRFE